MSTKKKDLITIIHLFTLSIIPLTTSFILFLHLEHHLITLTACALVLAFGTALLHYMTRIRPVYLVDYSCYRPPSHFRCKFHEFVAHMVLMGEYDESSLQFQEKVLERSGMGEETVTPEALYFIPPWPPSMADARAEAEEVMFGALDNLFAATKVSPEDIGVLVVNCSMFNPTPSLSAMIVNKYKMRTNIRSFNLGGLGCSAGIIAVDLTKDLLQVHRNTYAVVVSTETLTLNKYSGNCKSMLLPNCLFRVGGAALLLSNHTQDRRRAKYKLAYLVRTHRGAHDKAFRSVYQQEDENGKTGVSLSKDLMTVAGDALKANITTLGPLVLPIREKLLFLLTLIGKKLLRLQIKSYVPDFKSVFEHFCIHAGGRAVIDELERNLGLSKEHVEASRMTLHRFGNTSSSSIWYELGYLEAKGRMRKGDRVWQIAFGSGFKCNSAVWITLRDVEPSPKSPWLDCIHKYPVEIPK
ncbi:hypothetical protein V2J09_008727 [Rumex salicifolius]